MSFKVLIIGQGIAGTTMAFRCIQKGLLPVIIDPGMELSSSYVAVGLVNPISLKRVTPVWEVQNCLSAFHDFHNYVSGILGKNFFVQKSIIKVFQNQSDLNTWTEKEDLPLYSDYMQHPKPLPRDGKIEGMMGGAVEAGGWVRTKEFLSLSRQFFREQDMLIESEFNLREFSIEKKAAYFRGIEYDILFDCSGSSFFLRDYFPEVRIVGNKGEVMTIVTEDFDEDTIYSSTYFLLKYRQSEYKVGATYSRDITSLQSDLSARMELENGLQKFFKGKYTVEKMEAGIRPTVPDRKPIIGMSPINSRIAILNGLGSRGYLTAPLLSEILLDSIIHSRPIPHEVSCLRFSKPPANNE